MNSVQLIGRLTHDPDADQTVGGTQVTTFRLAIDRQARSGADFVSVKAWERLAAVTAEHLRRGRRVAVQGRLAHEEWIGLDRRRAERLIVVADRVEFLDPPDAATPGAEPRDVQADPPGDPIAPSRWGRGPGTGGSASPGVSPPQAA